MGITQITSTLVNCDHPDHILPRRLNAGDLYQIFLGSPRVICQPCLRQTDAAELVDILGFGHLLKPVE